MHRFCPFLLLLFIIISCFLAQPELASSNVAQNGAIADPMEEPWHNSESRLSSGWLLKLRRKRDGESANEQIQKCIQENTATEATPPPADPNDDPAESGYGKCDLALDCCNLVNEDKKENEKVDCDCAKLMPKMK